MFGDALAYANRDIRIRRKQAAQARRAARRRKLYRDQLDLLALRTWAMPRKLQGRRWWFVQWCESLREAVALAGRYREDGYEVQVAPSPSGERYGVSRSYEASEVKRAQVRGYMQRRKAQGGSK